MKISRYFTFEESTQSEIAIRNNIHNNPTDIVLKDIIKTAIKMDEVRELLGFPIIVSSFYRCLDLNRILRSKDTSQHVKGKAVDFICPKFGSNNDVIRKIIRNEIDFDQLILEYPNSLNGGWVHISFVDENPRAQVLIIDKDGTRAFE